MKRLKLILLSVSVAMGMNAADTVLTLDDCLRIALDSNPSIKIADMEIERVDYSKKEILGQLLPKLDFGGTYSRTLAKQTMYMNTSAFMPGAGDSAEGGEGADGSEGGSSAMEPMLSKGKGGASGFKVGLDNSFSMGFSAGMPLIAPQLWKSLKLSDAQILQSVEQSRASKLNLVNEVKSAYYTLLLAKDSKKVIQESYDMANLTHEIYVKKHSLGAASEYDVLRTSVAVKNVEPELLQADIAIKQAMLQLKILMGMDATFDFDVSGELSDYQKDMFYDTMTLSRNYTENSDLKLNELTILTLDNALQVQKMSWYPTLALSANYNWTSMSDGNPLKNFRWTPYSMLGVTLSVPIFQGGQRYYKQKQTQLQLEQMRFQRETLERSVAMQVDLTIDNIEKNVKQISSTAESVGQAERAHTIMEKSFNIGSASYLDLRDSELALTQARLTYYQSIFNYLIARSSLELLQGDAPLEKWESTK